jgi:hypothetical protein
MAQWDPDHDAAADAGLVQAVMADLDTVRRQRRHVVAAPV